MSDRARAVVTAINPPTAITGWPTVDVLMLGAVSPGLRYPVWYTPQINDPVVVEWLGSKPYVATAFA